MAQVLKDYPLVSLKTEELDGKIDFTQIFGRKGPVHIEIGSGKGTFLVNQARSEQGINFLGIEWASKYYRHAVDRVGRWFLPNVRVIRTEAAGFLAEFIGDNAVDCFHIYFPDPWPKKRHHKRRFLNSTNLEQMLRSLKPEGTIMIATDHAGYFEQIEKVVAEKNGRLEKIDFCFAVGADEGEVVGTNFERKYLKEQRRIYRIAVRKIS